MRVIHRQYNGFFFDFSQIVHKLPLNEQKTFPHASFIPGSSLVLLHDFKHLYKKLSFVGGLVYSYRTSNRE